MAGLSSQILEHEGLIRLLAFALIFIGVATLEYLSPRRDMSASRLERWPGNIGLNILSNLILRFGMPLLAVETAFISAERGWGLFNWLPLPFWLEVLLAIVILDCLIYWQHVFFHKIPVLWRLHQVHHTDRDFDTTTALRFHPFEILISMLIKIVAVMLLGASAVSVILFEIVLNGMALFNHGNLKLPAEVDGLLRRVIVTPDMHRVHHSEKPAEYNRNFGFNLSIWDRLFKSYRAQPSLGHKDMTIGQRPYPGSDTRGLGFMLLLPFRR